jgi:SAM-dependent methyltransferase
MPSRKTHRGQTEHAQWYDSVVAPYERSHRGYPEALIDDVLTFAGLQTGGKVLEIGCGTGQATTAFAARGLEILALEPGANLAARARQNLALHANVRIACESFESWKLEPEAFDLIISAHAFHWVDRSIRFTKALAIFRSVAWSGHAPVDIALRRVIGDLVTASGSRRRWPCEGQFSKSRYFAVPEKRRYPFVDVYETERFTERLQCTFSFHHLSVAERKNILASVRRIITENGGTIAVPYESQLIMARRETNISWLHRLLRRKK